MNRSAMVASRRKLPAGMRRPRLRLPHRLLRRKLLRLQAALRRLEAGRATRKKRKMSCSAEVPASLGFKSAVVTVSDSCARGSREDVSGPAVMRLLQKSNFNIARHQIVSDDSIGIQKLLLDLTSEVQFIVTVGGTGIAPRDVTPDATRAVCDRLLDGVAERMRSEGAKQTPFAALSRGV